MNLPTYEFTDAGLLQAMHALGNTPAKVHENLFALGVRGKKGCAEHCPLAEYIYLAFPEARGVHVYLDDDGDAYVLVLGHGLILEAAGLATCGQFVRNHDKGLYPDLIEEAADAAVA